MAFRNPSDAVARDLLGEARRIAIVGCSPSASRRSHHIAQAVDGEANILWTQLGVGDERAAARARAAGVTVVMMDRCPGIEYGRLL